ncbi:MAG: hypothetical protein HRT37_05330 [Alteromonadaceae bacterium]|nr:hypothetical protein [Alteromonadaceae bacterium]
MSLIDLKKSKGSNVTRKIFTIDEFIADADNYAKGEPELVSAENIIKHEQPQAQKSIQSKKNPNVERTPFRHATFTLSVGAISKLQKLATDTQLAKSHIIRILIDDVCNEDQQAKLQKLMGSKTG